MPDNVQVAAQVAEEFIKTREEAKAKAAADAMTEIAINAPGTIKRFFWYHGRNALAFALAAAASAFASLGSDVASDNWLPFL